MSPDESSGGAWRPSLHRALLGCGALVLLAALVVFAAARDHRGERGADRGGKLFAERFTPGQGLGPLFNDRSCAGCHLEPVVGGMGRDGLATVVRVGKLTRGSFVIGRRGPSRPSTRYPSLGWTAVAGQVFPPAST